MPLYEYQCEAHHTLEHYVPTSTEAPLTRACGQCGREAQRLFPLPNMLQYFSESNGRRIMNLDPKRVIHSHGEHQRLMKQRGLEPATDWHVSMKQTDGLKTVAKPPHPSTKLLS